MDQKDILIIKLLSAAIHGGDFISGCGSDPDWRLIYREAVAHQVHTLIYPVIKNEIIEKNLIGTWKRTTLMTGLRMAEEHEWLDRVIKVLKDSAIQTVALKGIVLNSFYPHPELRVMGDVDLLIHDTDMEKACESLKGLGYTPEKDRCGKHVVLQHAVHLTIELHRELVEYEFLTNRTQFNADVWENLNEVKLLKETVWVLSPEMQVLHLCVHMAAHIIYGGFGLRQLCDLIVFSEKKYHQIDWELVSGRSRLYGVEKFVSAIFSVCFRLFDMRIPEALRGGTCPETNYIDKLISDIFRGGVFGLKDEQRASANALLKNTDSAGQFQKGGKLIRIIDILFPGYNKISKRNKYSYVKKSCFLLPVAWIHRLIFGLRRKDFKWKSKRAVFYDDTVAEIAFQRNELLQWLGLK
jgi:hypothetical protein